MKIINDCIELISVVIGIYVCHGSSFHHFFFFFLNTNHSLIMPQKLKKKISDGDSDLDESSESTLPPLAGLSLLDASFSLENKFKKSFFFNI